MTQEFVTLPREIVEQAVEALFSTDSEEGSAAYENELEAVKKLRAALKQPQVKQEQASTNTWSTADGIRCLHCHLPLSSHSEQRYCQRVEDGSQANQPAMTPIAQRKLEDLVASGYTISGYSVYHERKHQHGFVTGAGLVGWWKPEGVEYPLPRGEHEPASVAKIIGMDEFGPMLLWHRAWTDFPVGTKLCTHPQPKREPLTDKRIWELYCDWHGEPGGCYGFARAIEAAHNIK